MNCAERAGLLALAGDEMLSWSCGGDISRRLIDTCDPGQRNIRRKRKGHPQVADGEG
jgi:hypothetical protein